MKKFTALSKVEMKKIVGAGSTQMTCVSFGNICSDIFEDVCCQYEGQPSVVCKYQTATSPGFCQWA
jgi:lysyl-tRNA synthetase class II